MLERKISDGLLTLGTNAGSRLIRDLRQAQSTILVVSPYVSEGYLDLLIERQAEGVHVILLTTTDFEGKNNSLDYYRKLITQTEHTDKAKLKWFKNTTRVFFALMFIAFILAGTGTYIEQYELLHALWLAPVLLLVREQGISKIKVYSYTYDTRIHVNILVSPYTERITQNQYFVHSKIYMIDGKIAYLGSLNFTLSGQKYNYESCIRVDDPALVADIESELSAFDEDPDVFFRRIESVGKEIFFERLN